MYAFRQRSFKGPKNYLQLAEAQTLIAQDAGFGSWAALTRAVATGAPPVPAYAIDTAENRIAPRRQLSDNEWDELIAVMKERRITALDANGLMTDAVLARIAELDHVTALSLGGSRQLTDDGLLHLARMPQLQHLNLSEYPGGKLTDRGLEVLRHLPNLRTFEMTWQRGITDAGVANLRFCDQLERVDLMGSPTGDGAIEALQGKPELRHFSSGRLVTDAGLPLLHNFPMLKKWHGGEIAPDAGGRRQRRTPADRRAVHQQGTRQSGGARGRVRARSVLARHRHHVGRLRASRSTCRISVHWAPTVELSDNVAMRHIAAMPRLRRLRAQETVATDDGFEALSQSKNDRVLLGTRVPELRQPGIRRALEDAGAARPRRELQECRRRGAVDVAPVSRASGAHADRREG